MEKQDNNAEIITEAAKKKEEKHVILVPYPYQGHTTPMIDLASILHSKGFTITIAHPKVNFPRRPSNPSAAADDFTFVELDDESSGLDTSVWNQLAIHRVLNESCAAPLESLLARTLSENEVACVVYDPLMNFAGAVAKKLGVKAVALFTAPAAYVHSNLVFKRLVEQKVFPLPESQGEDEIPGEHPLRYSDVWPLPAMEIDQGIVDITNSYLDMESASAILWNTFDFLDGPQLEKIQKHHWQVPFFPIGPTQKLAHRISSATTTLIASARDRREDGDDDEALSWLDKHGQNSVVYVSLGTMISIDEKSLLDLAWGLAKSEQPFLWSLRRSLLNGGDAVEALPLEFREEVKDRGLIVEWADQNRVLAHESVGAFLSHCGWNSILESLCEGVPLICRPFYGDQPANARYVAIVWKLGIELEKNCGGDEIARRVRALVAGEEGEEIRRRAAETKEKIDECTREGGSSHESIVRLVDFISSPSSS